MEAFTDIEQSKKLAEILPIESADMHYNNVSIRGVNYVDDYRAELMDYNTATTVLSRYTINPLFEVIPCWSLTALLDIIPVKLNGYKDMVIRLRMDKGDAGSDEYNLWYEDISTGVATSLDVEADSFVDACYEMILKLHEQNLL